MKKNTRILALVLAVMMLLGSMITATAEEPKYAEEIIIGIPRDIDTLNPMQSASLIEAQMVYYCTHETLVYLDPETREITGDIAESWDLSEDGLTYTFYLKKGIKFHNGEELKASDVKFSLDRCKESTAQKSRVALVESVSVVDDYTVEIKLSKVFLDFLYNLSQPNVSIVSEKAVTEMGDDGEKIGTGPYMNSEWVYGQYVTLERFDDYHGEPAKTKKLTFQVVNEDAARVIALEAGDIDICYSPAYVDHQFIEKNKDLELVELNGLVTYYLAMNTENEYFSNEKVRQAIACAVNKEDCIAVAFGGTAIPATSVMPAGVPMYLPVEGYSRDIEKAKALLAEAGYADGFTMEIGVATDPHQNVAQVIQANLAEIGITVNVVRYDNNTLKQMTVDGTHQAASQNYSNGSGPDGSFTAPFSSTGGSNRCRLSDPYIDEMVVLAGAERDETKRAEMYQELNQYITDMAYWVPIAIPNVYVGIEKGIEGVKYAANIRHDFSGCYMIED